MGVTLSSARKHALVLSLLGGVPKPIPIPPIIPVPGEDCPPAYTYHDDGKDCLNATLFNCGDGSSVAGFICDGDLFDDFECEGTFECEDYFRCEDSFDTSDCPNCFTCMPIQLYVDDDGGGPPGKKKTT
jgi:hypothetical protein